MPIPLGYLAVSALLTNLANRQLSQEQMQHEENMVDKQNEYNLPINQMQRLKDAGINPSSLGMGQGLTISGNTSAQNNGYMLSQMIDPLLSASNAQLMQAQAGESSEKALSESTFRDERLKNLQLSNDRYKEEIVMLGLDQRAQQIANDYAAALNEVALLNGQVNLKKSESEIREIDTNVEKMQAYISQKLPAELQKLASETGLNLLEQNKVVAEIQRLYADTDLLKSQTNTEAYKQDLLSSESQLNRSQDFSVQQQIQFFLDTYEDALKQFAADSKLSQKEARWYVASKIFEGLRSIGGAAAGAGVAAKAAKVFAK